MQEIKDKELIDDYYDDDDYCYECGGYGDDYYYDEETEQLVSNCASCPHNRLNRDDD